MRTDFLHTHLVVKEEDGSVWRSEIKLEDGRDSAIGIDSGLNFRTAARP